MYNLCMIFIPCQELCHDTVNNRNGNAFCECGGCLCSGDLVASNRTCTSEVGGREGFKQEEGRERKRKNTLIIIDERVVWFF